MPFLPYCVTCKYLSIHTVERMQYVFVSVSLCKSMLKHIQNMTNRKIASDTFNVVKYISVTCFFS